MASIKFSAFTNEAVDAATTQLVGYKVGDATANYRYSITQLATALSPSIDNFYTANGTIGTTRIAKVTDTVTFQNVGGTSSLFSLNTNGTFTLGKGAAAGGGYTAVAIGSAASCGNNYSVAIGANSNTNSHTYSVAIGGGSVTIGGQAGVAIGGNGTAVSGDYGVAMGYRASTSGDYSINLGSDSRGTGATSITLNSSGGIAAPAVASGFGVYMASHTYADFEVAGGVSKFSFDADSFTTITVGDNSNTTLETGETGSLELKSGGNLRYTAATHTFQNVAGAAQATVASLRQECFMMAASDETTDITVATDKVRIQMPYAFTLTEIKASLTTAPTGSGATTVNIYNVTDGDTVINTAALSFAAAAISANSTSFTAGQETIAEDAVIAVDVAAIAGTTGGAGLKVTLIGYQTV